MSSFGPVVMIVQVWSLVPDDWSFHASHNPATAKLPPSEPDGIKLFCLLTCFLPLIEEVCWDEAAPALT